MQAIFVSYGTSTSVPCLMPHFYWSHSAWSQMYRDPNQAELWPLTTWNIRIQSTAVMFGHCVQKGPKQWHFFIQPGWFQKGLFGHSLSRDSYYSANTTKSKTVVTEPAFYLTVILFFLCLRPDWIETVLVCRIEFVSHSCCQYGFSLFAVVTPVWCSVHLDNHQKALLSIGYTVGCCNAHTYSVWDVCPGVVT